MDQLISFKPAIKKRLPFKLSAEVTLGVELELQIIDPNNLNLASKAKDLIRSVKDSVYQTRIKPEITQSMIEINSGIHATPTTLLRELNELQTYLLQQAKEVGIKICGSGSHPFEEWSLLKIFPTPRFKTLSRHYRYLSKNATVFGQHVHIGCKSAEDALYLTHALARYVPQLIAISAASPYYQGVDTGYVSSRSNVFHVFPFSGVIPYLPNWHEFSVYFYKLKSLGIISTMKDVYWDIRPKPEFGTVEVRVCDTPLTIKKAVMIAAYLQTLALYLLQIRPITLTPNFYDLYSYNRFQALRYGFVGNFIDPETMQQMSISDDILATIKKIAKFGNMLNNTTYLGMLKEDVTAEQNDAALMRTILKEVGSLPNLVKEQCNIWASEVCEEPSRC